MSTPAISAPQSLTKWTEESRKISLAASDDAHDYPLLHARLDALIREHVGIGEIKPVAWLLRHIAAMYKAKLVSDMTARFEGHPMLPCFDFLCIYFRQLYGDKKLLVGAVSSVLVSLKQHLQQDMRISLFTRFLTGVYQTKTLNFFLRFAHVFDDCTYGPDYTKAVHGNKDDCDVSSMHRTSLLRCQYVIRHTLLERPYAETLMEELEPYCERASMKDFKQAMIRGVHKNNPTPKRLIPVEWVGTEIEASRKVIPRIVVFGMAAHLEALLTGDISLSYNELATPRKKKSGNM